tara:strand:+ start:57 stop:632 length:576 start_codon:yes stop_codon:yes gene_type:complete
MEYKYLLIIASIGIIAMISIMIAKNNDDPIALNPITSFYDIEANSISGEPIKMEAYKGKKILVVNVASKCGLTPQYAQLEKLYQQHSDKLIILGFPSNDFLRQEPGSNEQIATFCSREYAVTFPLFEKIKVKGSKKHSVYDWLTNAKQNGWNKKGPSWNFTKYLINEDGKLIKRFSPKTSPLSNEIVDLIK